MKNFAVSLRTYQQIRILNLSGELDEHTVNMFSDSIKSILDDGAKNLILEFDRIESVSPGATSELKGVINYFRINGGELKITGTNDKIETSLLMADRDFSTFFSTEVEAYHFFGTVAPQESLGFGFFDGKIRVIVVSEDGSAKFLDRKRLSHNLLYTYSLDGIIFRQAIEELEFLVNKTNTRESELQNFFIRHPEFLTDLNYKTAHPHIVLQSTRGEKLIPDFVLEPIENDKLCDILELKRPTQKVFIEEKNRMRFSASVLSGISQLQTYGEYFENPSHRSIIESEYGLMSFRPKLFLIIGRNSTISPINRRKVESSFPQIELKTYDDILLRMKKRIF